MMLTSIILASSLLLKQDTPVAIPKADLPKEKQECVICNSMGNGHGLEKAAAGARYKGKEYFFCNVKELDQFIKDPGAFIPPVLPRPMPKFDLKDTTGKVWNTASFESSILIVDFWATWCGPCKEMKPIMDRFLKKYAETRVNMLSVSIDEKKETLDTFLKKNKFDNPVLFDSNQAWKAWNVRVVPTFFVVKNGEIVAQWTGKKKEKEVEAIITPWFDPKTTSK